VLHGFAHARGDILVVMDADLQHPPDALPATIAPLLAGRADFVIGSRHADRLYAIPRPSALTDGGLAAGLPAFLFTTTRRASC
jgi:glycosyltransferase involved in cell wall biosynthesis